MARPTSNSAVRSTVMTEATPRRGCRGDRLSQRPGHPYRQRQRRDPRARILLQPSNGAVERQRRRKGLVRCIERRLRRGRKRGFLRLNAVSLAFTADILAFLLISLGAIAAIPIILDYVYLGSASEWLISVGRWPLLFIALVVGLGILYRFGPSRDDAQWKWVSPGALVAAVAWVIGSILFSWYVANFEDYNKAYGAVGAVIGLMTWIWLSATILLVGAELNAEAARQTDRDTTEGFPMPIGARGADAADRKA